MPVGRDRAAAAVQHRIARKIAATASTIAPAATSARLRPFMAVRFHAPASRTGRPGLVVAAGDTAACRPRSRGRRDGRRAACRSGSAGAPAARGNVWSRAAARPWCGAARHAIPAAPWWGPCPPAYSTQRRVPVVDRLVGLALEVDVAETVGADLAPAEGGGEAKQEGHGAGNAPRGVAALGGTIAQRLLRRKVAADFRRYPHHVAVHRPATHQIWLPRRQRSPYASGHGTASTARCGKGWRCGAGARGADPGRAAARGRAARDLGGRGGRGARRPRARARGRPACRAPPRPGSAASPRAAEGRAAAMRPRRGDLAEGMRGLLLTRRGAPGAEIWRARGQAGRAAPSRASC